MPRGKKHTAEQIIGKFCEAEIAISKGGTTKEAGTAHGNTRKLTAMSKRLAGKVAWISGATSGIGAAAG